MRLEIVHFSQQLDELKTTVHQLQNAPSASAMGKKKRVPKDLSVSLISSTYTAQKLKALSTLIGQCETTTQQM